MMTITEALAELKTIEKRIEKKKEFVFAHFWRQEAFKDPLASDGGSTAAISRERQAITDLEERRLTLRRAIAVANQATSIGLSGSTRTMADWIVWKREIAPQRQKFLNDLKTRIAGVRQNAMQKGYAIVAAVVEGGSHNTDVLINVSEKALAEESESLEKAIGDLDGLLSLKNATVTIEL